jgi:hypothetical protein
VYRHRERILAEGVWQERSRRPRRSPATTPAELDAWICKLRADLGVDNGADFIVDALRIVHAETGPSWAVPARSTVNRVLARHDLLDRNPAKRPRSSWRRFSYARPRDCYQIDATEVALAAGHKAVVFEVLDDCTRTLVASHAAAAETAADAVVAFTKAVKEYGAPALVLSDNGVAFTSRLIHPGKGPSSFVRAVMTAKSRAINSSPYHPQTCGKVERHHQTFKKWLRTLPAAPTNLAELQLLLDSYRRIYNDRRHSALPRRATPNQTWADATSIGGPSNLPMQTDALLFRCNVYETGAITFGRHRTSVGRALVGTTVTAICDNDHATIYDTAGAVLGHAYLDPGKSYVTLTPAT